MLKSAINRRNLQNLILNTIKKSKQPISTQDIASQLKKSWHTIIRYCLDLELQSKLAKITVGRISLWMIKK